MSWLDTLGGILFVGHSLLGPTAPDMLGDLLPGLPVAAQIIPGAPLKYNWDMGHSAETDARAELARGQVGALVLTEAVPLAEHLEWSQPADYAGRYHALASGANPAVRVFLMEGWPDRGAGPAAWRAQLARDLPRWQGIVDAVNDARPPGSAAMALIPAGQALARLDAAAAAGTVPGLADIGALFSDDIHLTETGHYFIAMLHYAAITGQNPEGLPHRLRDRWGRPFDAPDPALAARLQQIAWQVAQAAGLAGPDSTPDSTPDSGTDNRAAQPQSPAPPRAPPAAAAPEPQPEPAPEAQPEPAPTSPPGQAAGADRAAALPDQPGPPAQSGLPALPGLPPPGPQRMAINLSGVNDWSVQQPFLDVMKTARPWLGHLPGQWGGMSHEDLEAAGLLDPDGWPRGKPGHLDAIGTLILTDLPETASAQAGRYRLRFDGDGIVEVGGRARNLRYGKGEVLFDFTPGPGAVDIRIQRSDRRGRGDPVRNITVVKLDHAAAFDAGAIFNPDWLARLEGFAVLRFMDWMKTNESDQAVWADRPRPQDYTWALSGVPAEIIAELANRTGTDPWVTMPHAADDDYVRRFAEVMRARLDPARRIYVEYSNEVWNWQFPQADWADAAARARWGAEEAWIEFYGGRSAEIAAIWDAVFGAEAATRVINVIATQTGWLGLEERILNAPLWVAEAPGRAPPAAHVDAYAITGYFGAILGLERHRDTIRAWLADSRARAAAAADALGLAGQARADHIARHRFDAAAARAGAALIDGAVNEDGQDNIARFLRQILPYHKAVAEAHGLELIMYEGGSHAVGIGAMVEDAEITEFLIHFNYTAEMGALYQALIAGWYAGGGALFNHFNDVYAPTKWGSWGALRHLADDNPRWDALRAFLPADERRPAD